MEVLRNKVTCPGSQNEQVVEQGWEDKGYKTEEEVPAGSHGVDCAVSLELAGPPLPKVSASWGPLCHPPLGRCNPSLLLAKHTTLKTVAWS